jgi:methyl coenzyme M reductase beta subunit
MSEIADHLRARQQPSATLQKLVDLNRQQRDEYRAVARSVIEGFQQQMATASKVDPRVFGQVPDYVVDQILAAGAAAKSLVSIPGAKVNVTFTSEVTVNGVRLPDECET